MCKENMTRDFLSATSECSDCPAGWKIALIALGLIAVSFCLECEAEERLKIATDRICFTPALKQLFMYLIIWGSFGLSTRAIGQDSFQGERGINNSDSSLTEVFLSSSWYLGYRSFTSIAITSVFSMLAPDCWSSNWASPLYAYCIFAFCCPLLLLFGYFVILTIVFHHQRHHAPPEKRILLLVQGELWRNYVGQKVTIIFSRLCLITLYLWSPLAATSFSSALACRNLADGVSYLAYDPTVPCGGPEMSLGAQLAMPGLMVYVVGFPFVCFITILFFIARLDSPRITKCLGFLTDFYSSRRVGWECLRLFLTLSCVCVSLFVQTVEPLTIAWAIVSGYGILVLFFKPYGAEMVPSWCVFAMLLFFPSRFSFPRILQAPFKEQRGPQRHFSVPLTLHARELALCSFLAFAIQFHFLSKITQGVTSLAMECMVVLASSCGQLLFLCFVLYEAQRVARFYWERYMKRKKDRDAMDASYAAQEELAEMLGGQFDETRHRFHRSDERFFVDAVRIAPFPAEAIAQLKALANLPDLASFDIVDAAGWIFDQGHIEVQGQILYATVGQIASMYSDLTYDISTSEQFTEELKKLLDKVATTLNIQDEVAARVSAAARVRSCCGSRQAEKVGGLAKAEAALARAAAKQEEGGAETGWKKMWGVQTDADVALKWLQHQMQPQGIDPAVLRAQFVEVFPDAGIVEMQKMEIEVPPSPTEPPGVFARIWYHLVGSPPPPPPKSIPDPLGVKVHPINAADHL
ncbi:transmembrane domain-containing protein [Cyclospora cayetanensis]|uniref:Transmembrane domain-containing protein n=1 Tax=Cyclospora cayetanensis TaxID=88456 RepID=A0A1D3D3J3_9EIME|nr:transmembrane domain-containing protein [Cyclospora cayetanensis]